MEEIDELRIENRRLRAALKQASALAKGFWLTYPFENIMDVDDLCGICEGISTGIDRLTERP